MKAFVKINRWDLNFILTMVGFPFFTILISNSAASIAYRGFALLVAIMCLWKTGLRIVHSSIVRVFLIVLLYVSIQNFIGVFLGEYADYPYPAVKYMYLMFNVGILWIPLLAFVTGFSRINWNKSVLYILILLFVTILHAILGTVDAEASVSGRYDMGRLSTLAFGDNGSYLVLMATSLLATRKVWLTKYKSMVVLLLIFAVLAGLFGILKAGSRGPFIGCLFGWLFLVFCMQGRDRRVLLLSIVALIASGVLSLAKLAEFAPALYNRFVMTVEEGDTSGREELFEETFARFENNPVFGTNTISLSPTQFSTCHNVYLETLEGGGIVIFALFVFSFLCITIRSIKIRKLLLQHSGYLFIFSLFFCNIGRGLSGIMLTSNTIYAFAFTGCGIILYYIKKGYLNSFS